MSKQEEQLRQELEKLHDHQEYQHRAYRRRQMFSYLMVIYALFAALAAFALTQGGGKLFELGSSDKTEVIALQGKIDSLSKEVEALAKNPPKDDNAAISALSQRLEKTEIRQSNIEQTILQDPDKAITATLLREKQLNLEKSLTTTEAAINRVESRVDLILISVIIVPLLGVLLNKGINKFWPSPKQEARGESSE